MYWLRRRLGCAGRERLRIVEALRAKVGEVWSAPQRVVGWSRAQTAAFAQHYQLQELARAVTGRGDAESLARIAWWGSALADLGAANSCAQRGELLGICAAFNLAVALFDTAIDEAPIPRLALVKALAPRRLHSRLYQPDSEATRLRSEHPSAALVVGLFDQALADRGRHFAGQHARLDTLVALLEAMYRSVLGQSDEPFIAKTGPVICWRHSLPMVRGPVGRTCASRVRSIVRRARLRRGWWWPISGECLPPPTQWRLCNVSAAIFDSGNHSKVCRR